MTQLTWIVEKVKEWTDPAKWNEHDAGGHFPAMEVPELCVGDLRAFFALPTSAN